MKKVLFFLLFLVTSGLSKSYTLYLASTKYLDVAEKYYYDVKFHIPDFYDTQIRTHEKKNYSLIIRKIPTIEQTKRVQRLLLSAGKYKDSYIKMYKIEPNYETIELEEKLVLIKPQKIKPFKQDIENSNEYITASTMYNTMQYKQAYEMFYKLFLKENHNLNINYFLAKSAFSLEMYDEATAAFERVLILKPEFNQARYDFARVLYKLKQKKEAKAEFEKLLKADITKNTKEDIKKYLKVLNKKRNRVNGTANIMIGLSRSSNVNNGLISSEYRLPGLNDITVEGEEPIADSAHFQAINLNFFNYFKSKPIRVKNSFLIYNKSFFNEKDENITVFSYKPALDYIKNNNLYTLELAADRINKRTDEDFYAFALSPKFVNKDLSTYIKYQRIMYTNKEHQEKDFEKIQLYLKVNLFKNMNYYTNIYKNRRIEDIRTDIDKYTIGNGINLFYDINPKNRINLNYEFNYSKYKYENIGFNTRRKDKNHLIELSFKHTINKTNFINISTSYIKNNSNQDAYIYNEKAIKLNYLKGFTW